MRLGSGRELPGTSKKANKCVRACRPVAVAYQLFAICSPCFCVISEQFIPLRCDEATRTQPNTYFERGYIGRREIFDNALDGVVVVVVEGEDVIGLRRRLDLVRRRTWVRLCEPVSVTELWAGDDMINQ